MSELELKLGVAAEDLPRLEEAILAAASGQEVSKTSLLSTYYDTPDLALRRKGFTLRVRRQGNRFLQTVKSTRDNDDPLKRGEWEDELLTDQPDLAAPVSGGKIRAAIDDAALRPQFTTRVDRTAVELTRAGGIKVEAALDRGEIRAVEGTASEPLSEVEFELKEGGPEALYSFAMPLLDIAPLRIEPRSKSERGYSLVEKPRVKLPVYHAEDIELEPDMLAEEAFRRIGNAHLLMLARNETATLGGETEGVHQMRVAARRLRSLLSAFKPMLPEDQYRWANDELKWLAGELGPFRNWDVIQGELISPIRRALPGDRGIEALRRAVARQRRQAHLQAQTMIRSRRYAKSMLALARWLELRGWREQPISEASAKLMSPMKDIAPELLSDLHKKALKRSRHFSKLSPEKRHELRIALKKLRYGAEFFGSLYDKDDIARYLKRVKPLQERLGIGNDVSTFDTLLPQLAKGGAGAEKAGGFVLGWHAAQLTGQSRDTRADVRRFRDAKPFW